MNVFGNNFIQNAYLVGTIVTIVTTIVGYFVVLRTQAFAGEALTDVSFTGATGAVLFGMHAILGMLGLTFLAALGMGALGERVRGRDVEIGMVLSFALGLGVLFLSIYTQNGGNANLGVGVLFGSILSVTQSDILVALGSSVAVLLFLALLFRPLLFASVDPEVAQTRGVPVRLLSIVFLIVLGVTTAECALVVGVLLVFALLIAPAATAQHFTHRPFTTIALSMVLGLIFTWGGLTFAFIGIGRHLPVSFYISVLAALAYFVSAGIYRLRAAQHYREVPPSCRTCRSRHATPLLTRSSTMRPEANVVD